MHLSTFGSVSERHPLDNNIGSPSALRRVLAALVLSVGLLLSAFIALLVGIYLGEEESGLDRLSEPYTQWQLVLSGLIGAAAVAGFRAFLRRKAVAWWLLTALIIPTAGAILLALEPAG